MGPREADGQGKWENGAVVARYRDRCARLRVHPRPVSAKFGPFADRGWLCAVIEQILDAMKKGDHAAAWIAIELIEEDRGFAFGKLLKARCARELKRFPLDENMKSRIRERVIAMLERGFLPHEFQYYVKLLARIGVGDERARAEALRAHENAWVRWHADLLLDGTRGPSPWLVAARAPWAKQDAEWAARRAAEAAAAEETPRDA